MKSEERHKLHQNALELWLIQTFEAIKPYQNMIIAGIIVLLVVVVFAFWWINESSSQSNTLWTQFYVAFYQRNPAVLENLAEANSRSSVAPVAQLAAADMQLAQGCNMLFVNKATANQSLNKAIELYTAVYQQNSTPILRAEAAYGLGQALESLGKLEEATKFYTEVTMSWPETVYAPMATSRLDDIKRTSIKEMYDKFAKFDPKPAFNQPSGINANPSNNATPKANDNVKPGANLDKMPEETPVVIPDANIEKPAADKKPEKTESKSESAN
jgi:tetratricopeptide (TPR) repeat protein